MEATAPQRHAASSDGTCSVLSRPLAPFQNHLLYLLVRAQLHLQGWFPNCSNSTHILVYAATDAVNAPHPNSYAERL